MRVEWVLKNMFLLLCTAAPSLIIAFMIFCSRNPFSFLGVPEIEIASGTGDVASHKSRQFLCYRSGSEDIHVPVRIRDFIVPTPLVAGESALLSCHYELQGNETLYAVKWYKDMGEFFRYIPRADPPYKTLSQPGIDVDLSRSNHREVYLRNMGLNSLGNYTCQVSTDAPYFRCVQTTRHLEVVVPPSDGPMLLLEEGNADFQLGDNVTIQCTSGKGKPAPQLTWYINDRRAEFDPKEREVVVYPDSMESSSLLLRFHLKPEVFKEGKVVLKCVATLHQLEAAATKEILAGAKHVESMASLVWLTSLSMLFYYSSSSVTSV